MGALRKLEFTSISFENDESGSEENWLKELLVPDLHLAAQDQKQTCWHLMALCGSRNSHQRMMNMIAEHGKRSYTILHVSVLWMNPKQSKICWRLLLNVSGFNDRIDLS